MSSSSHILVLGSNSVHSLVPSTLIAQVESLLEGHKLDDAFAVADAKRKKLEESIEIDEDQVKVITCDFETELLMRNRRRSCAMFTSCWDSNSSGKHYSKMQAITCSMDK